VAWPSRRLKVVVAAKGIERSAPCFRRPFDSTRPFPHRESTSAPLRFKLAPCILGMACSPAPRWPSWPPRSWRLRRSRGSKPCSPWSTVIGEYVLVEPPHRVAFTWGFAGSEIVPPGSSTVAVTLTPTPGGTHLRLVHTGLPHPTLGAHDEGWRGYLADLAAAIGARHSKS
jgi:hypothetical protein